MKKFIPFLVILLAAGSMDIVPAAAPDLHSGKSPERPLPARPQLYCGAKIAYMYLPE